MVPLVEKYMTKLRIVKCICGHEFATSMKIPKCSECLAYIKGWEMKTLDVLLSLVLIVGGTD